jgi:hypothetical protein
MLALRRVAAASQRSAISIAVRVMATRTGVSPWPQVHLPSLWPLVAGKMPDDTRIMIESWFESTLEEKKKQLEK